MNKKASFFITLLMILPVINLIANPSPEAHHLSSSELNDGGYSIVITGYDWGPGVNKVILSMEEAMTEVNANDFMVSVSRSIDLIEMPAEEAFGARTVLNAYISDEQGTRVDSGNFITLALMVGPDLVLGSPIKYIRQDNRGGNQWVDYKLLVTNKSTLQVWDTQKSRILPLIDSFDLTQSFKDTNGINMSYASFSPKSNNNKVPLIIWLHGGGEGGTDPSIPIIANRAANYASKEIQSFFGGAYVLAPQCPRAWMHNAEGVTTHGKEDDIYNKGLMELILKYVTANPKIDTDRIYVGGCSNGGYMALKLIMQHPKFFAAGYISALAYQSQYITDTQIQQIKHVPIWFIQSKDDQTTIPDKTVIPVYNRLIQAGAKNVHFSFFDHVIDLTGFFGGEDFRYNGHWSWIYSHANLAKLDYDGTPVMLNKRPVTIMEWLAAQRKK